MSDPNRKAEKEQARQDKASRYAAIIAEAAAQGVEFTPFPKISRLNRNITITEKIDGTNAAIRIEPEMFYSNINTHMTPTGKMLVYAQSRSRIITPDEDNAGFARWVDTNKELLANILGPGIHYGEWWGKGIQRGYGQNQKWFSLFNYNRWANDPNIGALANIGVQVVPVLYHGPWMAVVGGTQVVYPSIKQAMTLDDTLRISDGGPIAVEVMERLLSTWSRAVLRYAPDVALEQLAHRGSVAAQVSGRRYVREIKDGKVTVPGPEGIVVYHEAGRVLFKATLENDEQPKSFTQVEHEKWLDQIAREPLDE